MRRYLPVACRLIELSVIVKRQQADALKHMGTELAWYFDAALRQSESEIAYLSRRREDLAESLRRLGVRAPSIRKNPFVR